MEWGVHVSWVATRYVNKYTLKFYLGIKDLSFSSLSNQFLNCQYKNFPKYFSNFTTGLPVSLRH